MLFKTLYKFQPTCMVQEELKWKCPTTSPVSGTSVQSVNFSVALLILNEKLGEKKTTTKDRYTSLKGWSCFTSAMTLLINNKLWRICSIQKFSVAKSTSKRTFVRVIEPGSLILGNMNYQYIWL